MSFFNLTTSSSSQSSTRIPASSEDDDDGDNDHTSPKRKKVGDDVSDKMSENEKPEVFVLDDSKLEIMEPLHVGNSEVEKPGITYLKEVHENESSEKQEGELASIDRQEEEGEPKSKESEVVKSWENGKEIKDNIDHFL